MFEIIYTALSFMMGSDYWWVVGVILFLNYFIQKPTLLLAISSPLVWADIVFTDIKLSTVRSTLGDLKFSLLYMLSIIISYLIYISLKKMASACKISNRYALLPVILVYGCLIISFIAFRSGGQKFGEITFVLSLVVFFYSSSFVLITFDCLNSRRGFTEGIKGFLLLNTLNTTFLSRAGAQLGPNGTSPLSRPVRQREETRYLRKKAVQIAIVMVVLNFGSNIVGHVFFGESKPFLEKLQIPIYQLADMSEYKNIPRLLTHEEVQQPSSLHLAFLARSFFWYFGRIAQINFKILLLWMLGIYIKLGVDEPWKSKSFADFFRRTHVYVAHFYRVFVYPLVRPFTKNIKNHAAQKYVSIWLMIFMGGLIFQTLSHSYQLMFWKPLDIVNLVAVRAVGDSLLATFIVAGLIFENKNSPHSTVKLAFKFVAYIFIYTFLISISSSTKWPGYTTGELLQFFKKFLMFSW